MAIDLLGRKSRVERLREIVKMVKKGKKFSAFDLAVQYDVSMNVVYRDIKALKTGGYVPADWEFAKKERSG